MGSYDKDDYIITISVVVAIISSRIADSVFNPKRDLWIFNNTFIEPYLETLLEIIILIVLVYIFLLIVKPITKRILSRDDQEGDPFIVEWWRNFKNRKK